MRPLLPLLLALAALPAQAQTFTRVALDLPQNGRYTAIAPADYDADGFFDLLVRGYEGDFDTTATASVQLFRNEGAGATDTAWTFRPALFDAGPLGGSDQSLENVSDIAWTDYDNDGDLDVLLTGYGGNNFGSSQLIRNDEGAFGPTDLLTFSGPFGTVGVSYAESVRYQGFDLDAAAWGDYDNDGDLDLALPQAAVGPSGNPRQTLLFRNDGDTFAVAGEALPTLLSGEARWGDYDNDGDLDLLLADFKRDGLPDDEANGFVRLLRNDGGDLVEGGPSIEPFRIVAVAWTDSDGDGDLDLAVAGEERGGAGATVPRLRIYTNDGGSYDGGTDVEVQPPFNELTAVEWGDLDGDGDADLLVSGDGRRSTQPLPGCPSIGLPDGETRLFTNDGGTYADSGTSLHSPDPFYGGGTSALADYDNDGDLDFFIFGNYADKIVTVIDAEACSFEQETVNGYEIRLYRNDLSQPNADPSTPGGLVAELDGDQVVLAWASASDDHTPAAALTYNLQVSARLGSDIVSPMSRADGTRMLPEPGNVSLNTAWTLRGLAPGTYDWRVQAVDNAFNGGPFAEGGAFTVGAVDSEEAVVPAAFAVRGAYPNPLRGGGALRLDLPAAAEVSVTLYDVLGREVLRTAPEVAAAGAGRALALDVEGLPSGVYVWRVSAALPGGTERASGRLTVVR